VARHHHPAAESVVAVIKAGNRIASGIVYTTAQALVSARLKVPYVEPDGKR
jgi:protein involved in ribonucleotide reduction